MPNLVGIGNSQVPTNAMLGGLAYKDSVGEINLEKIKAKTSDIATDIFIYDTSKDSDGGAWRHKAVTQSWYHEKPSQYRGAKKEFPSVAVIIGVQNGNSSYLAIYDGDEPNMPLWMKFVYGTQHSLSNQTLLYNDACSVCAMNGVVAVSGNTGWRDGVIQIKFIEDTAVWRNSSYIAYWTDTIENRNVVGGYSSGFHNGSGQTLHGTPNVRAIDMAVLPAAQFTEGQFHDGWQTTDPISGLPIPAILVGTSSHACVIAPDDKVYDITGFAPTYQVGYSDRSAYIAVETGGTSFMAIGPREVAGSGDVSLQNWEYGGEQYDSSKGVARQLPKHCGNMSKITKDDEINFGVYSDMTYKATLWKMNIGINLTDKYTQTLSESVELNQKCAITTSFNSGWMHGECIAAQLASTDTSNLTDTNLVTNGDFSNGSTGWSLHGLTVDTSGGNMTFTSSAGNPRISQAITVEEGQTYYFRETSSGSRARYISKTTVSSGSLTNQNNSFFTVPAGTTTVYVVLYVIGTGNSATFDDIIVTKADTDRTLNNKGTNNDAKGLRTIGTLNRNPVATGAELVGYSNFSTSNYLTQPYNSTFDMGTGSFTIMFWAKTTGAGTICRRGTADATETFRVYLDGSTYGIYFDYGNSAQYTQLQHTSEKSILVNGRWNFVACQCSANNSNVQIFLNGKNMDVSINANPPSTFNNDSSAEFLVGQSYNSLPFPGEIALLRVTKHRTSIRTLEKIYDDERRMFQPNAKCTVYGTSNTATAIGVDDKKGIVHVGTSSGRSDFRGLVRINNTTDAVARVIDAHNGLVADS